MQISYHKGWSSNLGRDMEYKRYGHAGRPVVMFPTSRGRFFQYEDTGTIAALSEFIDSGRIQVWTLDGIDAETFFSHDPRPAGTVSAGTRPISAMCATRHYRKSSQRTRASNGGLTPKPIFSGCSMGAFHAANFVFRFPELAVRRDRAVGRLFDARLLRLGARRRHLLQLAARLPRRPH